MEHPQDIQSELQRIRPMLLSTARRIMGESDEAEDVVQDALLKLWTLRATLLRPIEPFATVLVRNLALNHLRRHSRKKISLSEIEQMEDATPTSTNDEKTAHLMRMFEKLPEQQRLVLRLHDMEGMDFEQIASITGTPATALRQQASRTRRHLRLRYLAAVSAVVALLLIPLFALRAWQYRQLEERYEGSSSTDNATTTSDRFSHNCNRHCCWPARLRPTSASRHSSARQRPTCCSASATLPKENTWNSYLTNEQTMNNPLRHCVITLMLCLFAATTAMAQNKIDKQMEQISTVGSATFTSAVERDPDTRQVLKVVKVLKISGGSANKLYKAFMDERDSGSFSEQNTETERTLTLTCESKKQVRIYMLHLTGRYYSHAQCTAIIKNKAKR